MRRFNIETVEYTNIFNSEELVGFTKILLIKPMLSLQC